MKILHILRSEPDDTVKKLMTGLSNGHETTRRLLVSEDLDWPRLVDEIFSHDKVICWW
jgi:hypothetical protein